MKKDDGGQLDLLKLAERIDGAAAGYRRAARDKKALDECLSVFDAKKRGQSVPLAMPSVTVCAPGGNVEIEGQDVTRELLVTLQAITGKNLAEAAARLDTLYEALPHRSSVSHGPPAPRPRRPGPPTLIRGTDGRSSVIVTDGWYVVTPYYREVKLQRAAHDPVTFLNWGEALDAASTWADTGTWDTSKARDADIAAGQANR